MRFSRAARLALAALTACACTLAVTSAQQKSEPKMSVVSIADTPEWQKLRALVGDWEGLTEFEGKKMPVTVEMRMTGDNSAVMHVAGKGTPHEMVTMFHPDGERLLATHYCAAHNQPRMALVKGSDPSRISFVFVDGTNIRPGDGHMQSLVITIKDADHHDEAWTSIADGKETPAHVFSYSRKK